MTEHGLLAGADLRIVTPHIHAIAATAAGGSYDHSAGLYDAVVGNPLYNRLVWGVPVSAYADACRSVLEMAPPGPLLDLGCGTLCFTADAYLAATDRPILLVDRSIAMLQIARDRLLRAAGAFPSHITLVCADALALQGSATSFAAAVSWGVYHVLPDNGILPRILSTSVKPGGVWAFSALVTDRAFGAVYLRLLARSGEVATLQSQDGISRTLSAAGLAHQSSRVGNMAFFQGERGYAVDR